MDLTVIHLDPAWIQVSPHLQFRLPESFADRSYLRLKASIATAGGNVQPIKVRAVDRQTAAGIAVVSHELVFGYRRLRVCQELGLPVLAMVESMTLPDAFLQLVLSNDEVPLLEAGRLYSSALRAGLYPSSRRLAVACGLRVDEVLLASQLAELPDTALVAADLRRVTKAAAKRLIREFERDPAGLLLSGSRS